jgi:phospholipase C
VPLLVAAAASIGAPAAFADHGTIHDRRWDVKFNPPGRNANYDITRATWIVEHGRFIHTVSVRGRIGDPRTGFGPLPQLEIRVPQQSSTQAGCDYATRVPADGRTDVRAHGCSHRSAKQDRGDGVSIKKVSRHTVKYAIRENVLGNPKAYQWRFDLPARACRGCVYDRIPNNHDKSLSLRHHKPPPLSPIKHVVIIYQENHSFDNVFGRYCVQTGRCDGTAEARLQDGSTMPLRTSPDVVPPAGHRTKAQLRAIDGGSMDGFTDVGKCDARHNHGCLTQYKPSQIPNLTRLASNFALSDQTFQTFSVPSFGAHIELVSASLDGFTGDRPGRTRGRRRSKSWGCGSHRDAPWRATPDSQISYQPSCIPDYRLDPSRYPYGGAYRKTRVKPMPTIMGELDKAGLSWKLYTGAPGNGYLWAICPSFAQCQYTGDRRNQVGTSRVLRSARKGSLPNFSVVLPTVPVSQHNRDSMRAGDNWIGHVVSSIENGPDWRSTAVFITYDDCGCFYDHVSPPSGLGIRTPMVIVSPWVKPGYVDSNQASIASMLSFTEHNFGLSPLNETNANAYDYADSFDYSQAPLAPVPMTSSKLSPRAREATKHPADDPDGT